MPKIEIYKDDLERLVRRKFKWIELPEVLLFAKTELDEYDEKTKKMKVDVKDTNRPDLWSVEGIARELRGHFKINEGLPNYKIAKSSVILNVDSKVKVVRPIIVGAIVKDLKFDNRSIEQLIQLQEKIALTFGRKRKEVAIGVYDWDKIKPPITYTTYKSDAIRFVPLDFEKPMTPEEIIELHPKGKEYGHLIRKDAMPIIIDASGKALSMPPIINSAHTGRVTEKTKNVFVEATGFDLRILNTALNVIVTALAERGGKIESVNVKYGNKTITTPDLREKNIIIDPEYMRGLLGMPLSNEEIIHLLEQSRYEAKKGGKKIICNYPAYRDDIMNSRDVLEDIAISFGYNELEPDTPRIATIGESDKFEDYVDLVKELMVGLGFQEVLTFILTSKENLFDKMGMHVHNVCELANPVSTSWSMLRNRLLPSLLEFLTKNQHVSYPQQIFEVGDCIELNEKVETKTDTIRKLCAIMCSTQVGYEDLSSVLGTLMKNLGIDYRIKAVEHPNFISGRVGEIVSGNKILGVIGEVHPQVLNNWHLEKPVVALELSVSAMWKISRG